MRAIRNRGDGGADGAELPGVAGELGCEVCGRLPSPTRGRLTVANLVMMVPIELSFNAAAVNTDLPFIVKVFILTVATSVLTIWVAEPPMMKLMFQWLPVLPVLHSGQPTTQAASHTPRQDPMPLSLG